VLVLVPAARLGLPQLQIVEQAIAAGGAVFAWTVAAPGSPDGFSDDQLVERLLEQRGALTDPRLPVIAEAIRIFGAWGPGLPAGIRISRKAGAVSTRFEAALRREGVRPSRSKNGRIAVVDVGEDGSIGATCGRRKRLILTDTDAAASALGLLDTNATVKPTAQQEPFRADRSVIDLIAQPPGRLLSETTSKRLLHAYGIASGPERLCSSPTEAVRFSAEIEGPVVLKLVRPALTDKATTGAVVKDVTSAARVRRVYQGLGSMAGTLGPPSPLGILVAAQIDGGDRIWLRIEDHSRLGRLIIGGSGDAPDSNPSIVLTAPVTTEAAFAALDRAGLGSGRRPTLALAASLSRFGHLAHDLAERIDRAEIHPLVATEGDGPAMALDAIVGVSGA
jgi:hypothetical protein